MDGPAVDLRVGGQTYRVRSTTDEAELQRLAGYVDDKMRELAGRDRALAPSQLVLVAIALAHELETERARRTELERAWRARLQTLLHRIDEALEEDAAVPDDDARAPSEDSTRL